MPKTDKGCYIASSICQPVWELWINQQKEGCAFFPPCKMNCSWSEKIVLAHQREKWWLSTYLFGVFFFSLSPGKWQEERNFITFIQPSVLLNSESFGAVTFKYKFIHSVLFEVLPCACHCPRWWRHIIKCGKVPLSMATWMMRIGKSCVDVED